jgi:hypothetical protein
VVAAVVAREVVLTLGREAAIAALQRQTDG